MNRNYRYRRPVTGRVVNFALAVAIAATVFLFAKAAVAEAPVPIEQRLRSQRESELVRENRRLRHRAQRLLRKLGRRELQVRNMHRTLRRRWQPSVMHAIALASTIWGVPRNELVTVGGCESHLNSFATNGRYRGVFQEGPMFEHGPFGQAGFSVFDPYANVFTAAFTVAREGWRQWECKP